MDAGSGVLRFHHSDLPTRTRVVDSSLDGVYCGPCRLQQQVGGQGMKNVLSWVAIVGVMLVVAEIAFRVWEGR